MTTNDIIRTAMHYEKTGIYTTDINSMVINFTEVRLERNMFKFYMQDNLIACIHQKAIKWGGAVQ